jgi:hypothetical protein
VAYGDDPNFFEIIRRELGQNLEVDSVLAKCLLILTQTETVEPEGTASLTMPVPHTES